MKKLVSWLLLIAMIIPMCSLISVSANSSGQFELLSVKAINDYQIKLEFSHELKDQVPEWLNGTVGGHRAGIALVSNTKIGSDDYYIADKQAYGSIAFGDSKKVLIFTSTLSVSDLLAGKNGWSQDGYSVKFFFYDAGTNWNGAGALAYVQRASDGAGLPLSDDFKRANFDAYEYMFADITPAPAFGVVSATALSDYMVEVKFSRDLHTNIVSMANGSAQMGLALVSDTVTGQEALDDISKNRISGKVVLGATKDTLIWTANEGSITEANSISSLLNTSEDGYSLKFYLYDAGCPWHGSGYIGAIQGEKVGSVETALPVPAAYKQSDGSHEYMFVDINVEALANDLELVSVTPINEYTFEVIFNKAVDVNSANLNANLRLLNANGTFYYTPQGNDFGYSIGNTIKPTEDPKVWTWTMPSDYAAIGSTDMGAGRIPSTNKSINYALDSWKDKLDGGCKSALVFLDPKDANLGYSQRVQAVDGGYLRTTQLVNGFECVYKEVSAFTEDIREGVFVESATIISDNQIMVVFSDEITMDYAPWISLRIVNEKGGHIDNARWQKRYAHYTIGGDTIVFTFDADMMDMFNLEGKYANIEGAVGAVLNFEELANGDSFKICYDGYIENIATTDGKLLKGTLCTRADLDSLNITEFTDARGELITLKSAIQVSDTQVEVTFSAPVDIPYNPYIALRVYDAAGNLKRFTHDGQDAVAQVPFTWYYSDETKTKITLMYPDKYMNDLLNLTGQFEYLNDGSNKTYLTIEELPVKDVFACPGNGLIDNIVGATSKLAATVVNTTGYEQIRIEVAEDTREELTLLSATIISGNEIILKFSAPIEIDYAPFFGLRILDENKKMAFDNGSPLQIYQGTWEFVDETHDAIKWTSKDWILEDMINLRGKWAKYKELGYQTHFCIEDLQDKDGKEIDVKGNGHIDNIVKADGKMLSATSRTFGEGYDGLYIAITEDYQEPEFYLKSVTLINSKQLALEFNKPVQVDEKLPYIGIRYVNADLALQYEGKSPLQYQGKWAYGNKEKTVLIITETFGGSYEAVVKQTDNYSKHAAYDVMFCIEEIPADTKVGDVEDGTIHNIFTDGNIRLHANKVAGGGGWDGLYMPITVNFDYKIPGTLIASAIEKDKTDKKPDKKPVEENADEEVSEEVVMPEAAWPTSGKLFLANHNDTASKLPLVAVGIAVASLVSVIASLVVVVSRKKDE